MSQLILILMTIFSAGSIYYGTKNLRSNKDTESDVSKMSQSATDFYSSFNNMQGIVTDKLKSISDVLNIGNPLRLTHDALTRTFTPSGPLLNDFNLYNRTARFLVTWGNMLTSAYTLGRSYSKPSDLKTIATAVELDMANADPNNPPQGEPGAKSGFPALFQDRFDSIFYRLMVNAPLSLKRVVFVFVNWQGPTIGQPYFTLQSTFDKAKDGNDIAVPWGYLNDDSAVQGYLQNHLPVDDQTTLEDLCIVVPVRDGFDVDYVKNYFGASMAETADISAWARSIEYADYSCPKNSSIATKLSTSLDEDLVLPIMSTDQYESIRALRNVFVGADLDVTPVDMIAEYGDDAVSLGLTNMLSRMKPSDPEANMISAMPTKAAPYFESAVLSDNSYPGELLAYPTNTNPAPYSTDDIIGAMRTKWFGSDVVTQLLPSLLHALSNSQSAFDPYRVGNEPYGA